jgi:hypothetical protein
VDLWGVESVVKCPQSVMSGMRTLMVVVDSPRGKHERSLGAVNK